MTELTDEALNRWLS